MQKIALSLALAGLSAAPVAAETFPAGFGYSGKLSYDNSSTSSGHVSIGKADLRLSYGFALNNGVILGVNGRYEAVSFDSFGSNLNTDVGYYSAFVSGRFGTLSIGQISMPSGDVQDDYTIGALPPLNEGEGAVFTGGSTASLFETQNKFSRFSYTGLRYDVAFGDTEVAIAYVDATGSLNANVVNGAVRGKIGENNVVYASFEVVDGSSFDPQTYSLGSETTTAYGVLGVRGRSVSYSGANLVTGDIYFAYKVLDNLTLTPQYTKISATSGPFSSEDWFSLTARYDLPFKGAYVYASYAEKNELASSDVTSLGLGFKF